MHFVNALQELVGQVNELAQWFIVLAASTVSFCLREITPTIGIPSGWGDRGLWITPPSTAQPRIA